jgi:hypothetical protein
VSGYESGVGERGKEEVGLLNSAPTGISSGYLQWTCEYFQRVSEVPDQCRRTSHRGIPSRRKYLRPEDIPFTFWAKVLQTRTVHLVGPVSPTVGE